MLTTLFSARSSRGARNTQLLLHGTQLCNSLRTNDVFRGFPFPPYFYISFFFFLLFNLTCSCVDFESLNVHCKSNCHATSPKIFHFAYSHRRSHQWYPHHSLSLSLSASPPPPLSLPLPSLALFLLLPLATKKEER